MLTEKEIKEKISKQLKEIDLFLDLNKPDKVLENIVKVYEIAIRFLYERYLGCLDNPEKMVNYFKKKSLNITKCQFGPLIGMLQETGFHNNVQKILHGKASRELYLVKKLNELNSYRIHSIHPCSIIDSEDFASRGVTKDISLEHYTFLRTFLYEFKLINGLDSSIENKFQSVNIQHLTGEIQLYKSLHEVLLDEDIDCLDVTYFSNKLPVISKNMFVAEYWRKITELLHKDRLTLRRTICVDRSNIPDKFLWIFFYLVPNYWEWLNQRAFFSVFFVSENLIQEVVDKPVNLINLILMYNKATPDCGHVWIFGAHEYHEADSDYIHLYGNRNIKLFHELYRNMFYSGSLIDSQYIKKTLRHRFGQLNNDMKLAKENVDDYVDQWLDELEKKGFRIANRNKVVRIYQEIFSDKNKEVISVI